MSFSDKPVSLEDIKALLSTRIQTLPCLPPVLLGVQKAIAEGEVGARELAHVILADPSLTARILRLSNSLYYAPNQKTRTVTQAILVVGFETVRNIVLGLSVYDMLSNLPRAQDYQAVWRHCLCCGVCSRHFATKLRINVPEQALVAGLLHDLGRLILGQFFPEQYAEVIRRATEENLTYHQAERKVFSITHEDAGRCIADHWGFPSELTAVVSHHEASTPEEVLRLGTVLQRIVAVANQSARFLYREDARGQPLTPAGIQTLCQRGLGIGPDVLLEIFSQIKAEVAQTARMLNITIDEWKYDDGEPEETDARSPLHPEEERLEFLLFSSDLLAETHPVEIYWKQTVESLTRILKLQSALLLVREPGANVLKMRFSFGQDGTARGGAIPLDAPDDVAAVVYLQRKAVAVTDANLHLFTRPEGNTAGLLGTHRIAAVPVHRSGGVDILVVARAPQGHAFEPSELRFLLAYARDLAQVL